MDFSIISWNLGAMTKTKVVQSICSRSEKRDHALDRAVDFIKGKDAVFLQESPSGLIDALEKSGYIDVARSNTKVEKNDSYSCILIREKWLPARMDEQIHLANESGIFTKMKSNKDDFAHQRTLYVKIAIDKIILHLVNVHLKASDKNSRQHAAKQVFEYFSDKVCHSRILAGGDFNFDKKEQCCVDNDIFGRLSLGDTRDNFYFSKNLPKPCSRGVQICTAGSQPPHCLLNEPKEVCDCKKNHDIHSPIVAAFTL